MGMRKSFVRLSVSESIKQFFDDVSEACHFRTIEWLKHGIVSLNAKLGYCPNKHKARRYVQNKPNGQSKEQTVQSRHEADNTKYLYTLSLHSAHGQHSLKCIECEEQENQITKRMPFHV